VKPSVESIPASPAPTELTEFQEDELCELEARGISRHHLALFLESLRCNLNSEKLRCLIVEEATIE
jgi:hypothetical protein